MSLNKSKLINDIKVIFTDLSGTSAEDKASALASAIDEFIKSGTVTTTVTVTSVTGVTTGTGVSGPGTGTGTGIIS